MKKYIIPALIITFLAFLYLPTVMPSAFKKYTIISLAVILIGLELYTLTGQNQTKNQRIQTIILIVLTAILAGVQLYL